VHHLVNKDFDMFYHVCWCFYMRLYYCNYSASFGVYVVTCLTEWNTDNFKFPTRYTNKFSLYFSLTLKVDYLEALSIALLRGPCNS